MYVLQIDFLFPVTRVSYLLNLLWIYWLLPSPWVMSIPTLLYLAAQGAQQTYNWSCKCGNWIYKSANWGYKSEYWLQVSYMSGQTYNSNIINILTYNVS